MNCARWDLCGGYWVTDIPTAILHAKRTFSAMFDSCYKRAFPAYTVLPGSGASMQGAWERAGV